MTDIERAAEAQLLMGTERLCTQIRLFSRHMPVNSPTFKRWVKVNNYLAAVHAEQAEEFRPGVTPVGRIMDVGERG